MTTHNIKHMSALSIWSHSGPMLLNFDLVLLIEHPFHMRRIMSHDQPHSHKRRLMGRMHSVVLERICVGSNSLREQFTPYFQHPTPLLQPCHPKEGAQMVGVNRFIFSTKEIVPTIIVSTISLPIHLHGNTLHIVSYNNCCMYNHSIS